MSKRTVFKLSQWGHTNVRNEPTPDQRTGIPGRHMYPNQLSPEGYAQDKTQEYAVNSLMRLVQRIYAEGPNAIDEVRQQVEQSLAKKEIVGQDANMIRNHMIEGVRQWLLRYKGNSNNLQDYMADIGPEYPMTSRLKTWTPLKRDFGPRSPTSP